MLPVARRSQSCHNKIDLRRQGYPKLAAFIDSDRDFAVFRSYGELHVRLLLYKQDELRVLQEELEALDKNEPSAFALCSRQSDINQERMTLFGRIETKLHEYDDLLDRYRRLLSYPEPHLSQIDSVGNWLEGNKPLACPESSYLDDRNDLVSVATAGDRGRLNRFIESAIVTIMSLGFIKDGRYSTNDQRVFLVPQSLITTLSQAVSTVIAVAALIAPIVVLFYVTSMVARIWVIAFFTLGFSTGLSWLTNSRQYEIFSATAAFCAVLVVFVGSVEPNVAGPTQ